MGDKSSVTLPRSKHYLFKWFDSIQIHNCFASRFVSGVKSQPDSRLSTLIASVNLECIFRFVSLIASRENKRGDSEWNGRSLI